MRARQSSPIWRRKLYRAIPSAITLTALAAAFSAIVLVMDGAMGFAGICILVGYLLDATDGAIARRIDAVTDFGKQLDSLVDLVTFGVAPAIVLYRHLGEVGASSVVAWLTCTLFVCSGAYRLARFNLLPTKTSHSESLGLTISTSGATLTLIALVNSAYGNGLISATALIILCLALAGLMASRIRYPALAAILRQRRMSLMILGLATVMALRLPPPVAGLSLTGGYVSFGVIRALVQRA